MWGMYAYCYQLVVILNLEVLAKYLLLIFLIRIILIRYLCFGLTK